VTRAEVVIWYCLTVILLTWRIWWAPNNASGWHIGFNWAFEDLILHKVCSTINFFNKNIFFAFEYLRIYPIELEILFLKIY